jgi:farnesyl diphosphate synthase
VSADYAQWARATRTRFEGALDRFLPAVELSPTELHAAMRYATLGGGKRIRALLAYSAAHTCGADLTALDHVAAAVEMIHAYSLVHDDLPCMDDDVLRRGQPTCHVKFGEATAMLAGDALQPLAFEVLAKTPVSDALRVEIISVLAVASGAPGMAGGQAIDLAAVGSALTLPALEAMHQRKTGALIAASLLMGAACAPRMGDKTHETAPQVFLQSPSARNAALKAYADTLGLAFQVVDDILDVEGDAATLGKTAGKDAAANKPTFVSHMGLAGAKARAETLTQAAHDALAPLGETANVLHGLADEILRRRY